jgi:hypothetical protein
MHIGISLGTIHKKCTRCPHMSLWISILFFSSLLLSHTRQSILLAPQCESVIPGNLTRLMFRRMCSRACFYDHRTPLDTLKSITSFDSLIAVCQAVRVLGSHDWTQACHTVFDVIWEYKTLSTSFTNVCSIMYLQLTSAIYDCKTGDLVYCLLRIVASSYKITDTIQDVPTIYQEI